MGKRLLIFNDYNEFCDWGLGSNAIEITLKYSFFWKAFVCFGIRHAGLEVDSNNFWQVIGDFDQCCFFTLIILLSFSWESFFSPRCKVLLNDDWLISTDFLNFRLLLLFFNFLSFLNFLNFLDLFSFSLSFLVHLSHFLTHFSHLFPTIRKVSPWASSSSSIEHVSKHINALPNFFERYRNSLTVEFNWLLFTIKNSDNF